MSKKITLLIGLLLLIAIPIGISFFSEKPKPAEKTPSIPQVVSPTEKIVNAQTSLAFFPSPYAISSSSGSLAVAIDTGENEVTAVQLEITYDPKVLQNVAITPGTFFENPLQLLKNVNSTKGKITYAFGAAPTAKAKIGSGTVATITFTTNLKPGEKTDITFSPETLVTAEGVRVTVLKEALGTTIERQ
ncbi:MAG: hypothetical protein HYV39_01250 [Candidatus Levybacteria bacterium]|nr:hypothetical protein [Candidatus Levybacteria bacterium]